MHSGFSLGEKRKCVLHILVFGMLKRHLSPWAKDERCGEDEIGVRVVVGGGGVLCVCDEELRSGSLDSGTCGDGCVRTELGTSPGHGGGGGFRSTRASDFYIQSF